jgi:DNA recombination protein RmuC
MHTTLLTLLTITLGSLTLGLTLGWAIEHFRTAATIARARTETIRLQTQLDTLHSARAELTTQFQLLANQILESHSHKFTTQNRDALQTLLTPLAERITDFRKKVEDVHTTDLQQRSALKQQVELLATQSRDLGQKADNLAGALKGDNKILGDWGELTLSRLLETSGLQKDRDYELQVTAASDAGTRYRPDAIIRLPDDRLMIVDAKSSLKDYMAHVNAETPAEREAALKAHVSSIETHLKNLSGKRYQDLPDFKDKTPDFVLMFIPSEPAFALALTGKPELLETAARTNVILVGPGSLLATLNLVVQMWRQENQSRGLDDAFEAIRKIYDKYAGFAEDMQRIEMSLQRASEAYHEAYKKLATGDGNLMRQLEKFRKDNIIKPRKLPPPAFQDAGEADD